MRHKPGWHSRHCGFGVQLAIAALVTRWDAVSWFPNESILGLSSSTGARKNREVGALWRLPVPGCRSDSYMNVLALELTAPWMHWRLDRRVLTVTSPWASSLLVSGRLGFRYWTYS